MADLADIKNPKKVTRELSQDDGMSGVAFRPDGGLSTPKRWRVRRTFGPSIRTVKITGSSRQDRGRIFIRRFRPMEKTIVFTSDRAGSLDLWRMNIDGGNVARLTEVDDNESQPSFTADGAWIVFQRSGNDGRSSIWKIPEVAASRSNFACRSVAATHFADGRLLACEFSATPNGARKIGIYSIDDSHQIALHDFPTIIASSIFRWSNDGKSLIYVHRLDGGFEIWSQPLSGGQPSRLAASNGDRIYDFDISRNGKAVVFSRGTENSDVILVNGIR
jgi:Tol biopolymer transport system component